MGTQMNRLYDNWNFAHIELLIRTKDHLSRVMLSLMADILTSLQIRVCIGNVFSYSSTATCVVDTQKNRLNASKTHVYIDVYIDE